MDFFSFLSVVTLGPLFARKIICGLYKRRVYCIMGTFPFLYTAAHGFQRVFKKLLPRENKGTERRNEGVEYVDVYETWVIFSLGRKAMWFPNIVSSGSLKSI